MNSVEFVSLEKVDDRLDELLDFFRVRIEMRKEFFNFQSADSNHHFQFRILLFQSNKFFEFLVDLFVADFHGVCNIVNRPTFSVVDQMGAL